ncbi:MAG TPA: DUF115 domain-containing protein [Spirochaetota bacterium]|nr:DUF115 domain-containing protein [Spirochaetota bacterium]HPJ33856.1 DUF115 domain-containing protein [Spirochaetota bacterium]
MINRDEIYSNLNAGLKGERGEALKRNLNKNLPLISSAGGLAGVVDSIAGKHAVVIGAGPSLDRNIIHLKKYRERLDFVYLATDMALKPLCRAGITPRFVITCETTPVDFFSGIDTRDIHLLAFSCSSFSNLRKWRGGISFYNWMIEGEPYTSLWDLAGRELGSVATGSIVTTQAVSIVLGCSISSLVLVGNDMGFYDRFYAAGTLGGEKRHLGTGRLNPGERLEMGSVRRSRCYEVKRDGAIFYTNNQFLAAKYWLEDLFGKNPYPVIDCSEPGCSEGSVTKMELYKYFEIFERKRRRGRR